MSRASQGWKSVQAAVTTAIAAIGPITGTVAAAGAVEDGLEILGPLEGSFGEISAGDVVDVEVGPYHALVLLADGSVRAAGWNGPFDPSTGTPCGQCDPPADLSAVIALAAGTRHSMALRSDGSVVGWGCGPGRDVPIDLRGDDGGPSDPAVAIAAGDGFSLALLASGDIRCWGQNPRELVCEVPEEVRDPGNPPVRILARRDTCVAVLQDHSLVRWGDTVYWPGDNLPPDAVIVDAVLSPQFDGSYNDFPSLAVRLADGRYVDGAGIRSFDETNPCVAIFPGPSTIIVLADGSWEFRNLETSSSSFPYPGEGGSTRTPVSLAAGGHDYLVTIPLPADCDEDGVPDREQIAADPTLDCDLDGRLDACRPAPHWFEAGPIVAEGFDLDLTDVPGSDAPVLVEVTASGDLDAANEFLLFEWNGAAIATAFDRSSVGDPDCPRLDDEFPVEPRIWNATDADERRILTVSPSLPVDPAECTGSSFSMAFAIEIDGPWRDCNDNGVEDDCEIADGLVADLDGDRIPDDCQPDCDEDGRPDAWAVFEELVPDCNANGIPDSCEKGRPGDQGDGDLDGDGCVGPSDLGILLSLWGATGPICGDLDGDGEIRAGDLGILLSNWDGCP
ncbi:MAG: hypothetical protein VX726_03355 [Planctomycetota bacterium]|nr:hypothetical protein [Planctomycetota bacterium]